MATFPSQLARIGRWNSFLLLVFSIQLVTTPASASIHQRFTHHHEVAHKLRSRALDNHHGTVVPPTRVQPTRHTQTNRWNHHETISGQSFFDSFVFIERWDNTTHAATYYVNQSEAESLNLAYVDNQARAIIAVDTSIDISNDTMPSVVQNTTDGTYKVNPLGLRKSIRLESRERYDTGTLVIADFDSLPFGCATWPAFWMYGLDWPHTGEIDIFEGWNDNVRSRATLHTTANCSHDPTGIQLGKTLQETCDTSVNYNAGCSVEDKSKDFYGKRFRKHGGGVFAAMYTDVEISVWRWLRDDIPIDVRHNMPRPESWGIPAATWKSGESCDIASKFGPQNLVINIATCGDSDLNTYAQGKCPGTCLERLLKGSHYKDAFFAIKYIKIFKGDPNIGSQCNFPGGVAGESKPDKL